MQNDLSPEQTQQLTDALATGRKIEAIKLCRQASGMGLKEAKEYVEKLTAPLLEQEPEKYAALKSTPGGGCTSVILLSLTLGWMLIRFAGNLG